MTPSVAERPARLVIPALPASRRICLALSKSPSASCSALLESIMPAPVASRRALTWADVISIWNGAPCHQVANSPPPPRRARRPEGDAWSCSWTPASELARLVLSGLWLGGGLRRGVGGRRLGGRGGGGAAVTGLEQLALPLRQWLLVGGAGRHRRGPLLGGGLGAVDRAEPQSLGDGIAEDALELLALVAQPQDLLLGKHVHAPRGLHRLELLQALEPPVDGGEVGEHATQPAVVHERHGDPLGLALDGFLGLLLGADEQHRAALGDRVPQERERGLDRLHGLLEVDDVDAVALAVDVARENPGPGGR